MNFYNTNYFLTKINVFFYFPFLPGNLLFECNNFAGGVDAVMAMPGARSLSWSGLLGLRTGKNC